MSTQEILNFIHSVPELVPLLIVLASFIAEDPTTIAVGLLIGSGEVSALVGFVALCCGIFLGDLGLYFFGRLGKRVRTKGEFLKPTLFTVLLARFIPGMRFLTFTAAGIFSVPLRFFIPITFFSSLVWTKLILSFTREIQEGLNNVSPIAILAMGIVLFLLIQMIVKKVNFRLQKGVK